MSTLFDGLDFGHDPHVDPATHTSAHAALVNAAGVIGTLGGVAVAIAALARPRGPRQAAA